jgi:hypothetical protein
VLFEDLGNALVEHVAGARREVLLVAPFVKIGALRKVLAGLRQDVGLVLVTRWRLDEIAAGVSDVESYEAIVELNGTVRLLDALHAKYFRADSRVLAGSANISYAALGWAARPNIEVLNPIVFGNTEKAFENEVRSKSIPVDAELAARYYALQNELRAQDSLESSNDAPGPDQEPTSIFARLPRDPLDMWLAYGSQDDMLLSPAKRQHLRGVITRLGIPNGIDSQSLFEAAIGSRLWLEPEVRSLFEWVGEGRRFGEVSERVGIPGRDRADAEFVAQAVYRNLLHFLPNRFERYRPRHSELLRQRV